MCVCLFLGMKLSDFGSAVVVPVRAAGAVCIRDAGREMAATAMEEQTHLRLLGGRGGNEGEYEGGREKEEEDRREQQQEGGGRAVEGSESRGRARATSSAFDSDRLQLSRPDHLGIPSSALH